MLLLQLQLTCHTKPQSITG